MPHAHTTVSTRLCSFVRTVVTLDSHHAITLGTALVAAIATACSDSGVTPDRDTPIVQTVTVTPADAGLVLGQSRQFEAAVRDARGTVLTDRAVTWSVSPAHVASVTVDGLVTATAPGAATLVAAADGRTGEVILTVQDGAVVTATGGTVVNRDGSVAITIPEGAISSDIAVTVEAATSPPSDPDLVTGTAYDLGPSPITFAEPVVVTLRYSDADLPTGTDPRGLRVHHWNGSAWDPLTNGAVDEDGRTVRGETSHFSTFAILQTDPVTFADPNLEAAVRDAIGMPDGPIHPTDLHALTALDASNLGIQQLDGLEVAVNLDSLSLAWNSIVDVSPLAGLTSLRYLDLTSNQLPDVGPLASLSVLQSLRLGANEITDISPLGELTELRLLSVTHQPVADHSPLANLTRLHTLFLTGSQVSDVGPLAGLADLEVLTLGYNLITDVAPLAGLTNLRRLDLNNNQITDLAPLVDNPEFLGDVLGLADNPLSQTALCEQIPVLIQRGWEQVAFTGVCVGDAEPVVFGDPNLEAAVRDSIGMPDGPVYPVHLAGLTSLRATRSEIRDLSGLEHAVNVESLDLGENEITDLGPLSGLTGLRHLRLDLNQIADLTPLSALTGLESLILLGNQIDDITPLAGLTAMRRLWLWGNQISDIGPLAGMTELDELVIHRNQISDITPLADLFSLRVLWIWDNQISTIGALAGLTALQDLNLGGNPVSDLSPLAGLTALQDLSLGSNQVSDLSPLAGLTALRDLNLYGNQISDLSPLAGLAALQDLSLYNNQISDVGPLAGLTALQWLRLQNNQITDLEPLVANPAFSGGLLRLGSNPLGQAALCEQIPVLVERGWEVWHDGTGVCVDDGPVEFVDPNLELAVREEIDLPTGPIYPSDLEGLWYLAAVGLGITDLTGLEHAVDLEWLAFDGNKISDLQPLANLVGLTHLSLFLNEIVDVTPLADLDALDALYLGANQIRDVSPLATLSNLQVLDLSHNQINDIRAFVDKPTFVGGLLDLRGNPLELFDLCMRVPILEVRGWNVSVSGTCGGQ